MDELIERLRPEAEISDRPGQFEADGTGEQSMNMINDGGPAFPETGERGKAAGGEGMTLRDYFAAKALPAMYRVFWGDIRAFGATVPEDWEMGIARDAYKLADAMLKAREGEQ